MVHGNFVRGKKFNTTSTLDGGHFSGVPWVSALIEGKGRLFDPVTGIRYLELPFLNFASIINHNIDRYIS